MKRILSLAMALVLVLGLVPVNGMAKTELVHPIIAEPSTSVERMREWAIKRGANPEFVNQAQNFYDISVSYGIDPAFTYAQSAKETAFFNFTGVVDFDYHNTCGLKIEAGGGDYDKNAHSIFSSWEEGILAQVHHIALYAGVQGFPKAKGDTPDPRHFPSIFGRAKNVEDMGGNWAPNPKYGYDIVKMMEEFSDPKTIEIEVEDDPIVDDLIEEKPIEGPLEDNLLEKDPIEDPADKDPIEDPDYFDQSGLNKLDTVKRIFGLNRNATSTAIARFMEHRSSSLILAPESDFPNALAASAITRTEDGYAPIILVGREVDPNTRSTIRDLKPEKIVVVGNYEDISKDYEDELKTYADEFYRIDGKDEYEISNNIADLSNPSSYILVNSQVFADALTISSYAAEKSLPILFTDGEKLDARTRARLEDSQDVLIVGGENSVSKAIEDQLKTKTEVTRIAGENRFQTAGEIAKTIYPNSRLALVTNAFSYPDSLSGGPLAASYRAPILLSDANELTAITKDYLDQLGVEKSIILGGSNSIGPEVYLELDKGL